MRDCSLGALRMAYCIRSIKCDNCGTSILLPVPIPHGINRHPPASNTGAKRIALICLECWHVHAYTLAEHPPTLRDEDRSPFEDPDGSRLTAIELLCANKNCGLPLTVLAVQRRNEHPTIAVAISVITESWTLHEIPCHGHPFVRPQSGEWLANR